MFCPKCKTEYEDWAIKCIDCNVDLVNRLPENNEIQLVEVYESSNLRNIDIIQSMLEGKGIPCVVEDFSASYGIKARNKIKVTLENQSKAINIIKGYHGEEEDKAYDQKEYQGFRKKEYSTAGKTFYLATRLSRFFASFIDFFLNSLVYLFLYLLVTKGKVAIFGMIAGIMILLLQILFLTYDGQSLGKKCVKIKIIKYDTGENGGFFVNVFLRGFVNWCIYLFFSIYALIDVMFIFRNNRRCIHDYIANTCVVEAK